MRGMRGNEGVGMRGNEGGARKVNEGDLEYYKRYDHMAAMIGDAAVDFPIKTAVFRSGDGAIIIATEIVSVGGNDVYLTAKIYKMGVYNTAYLSNNSENTIGFVIGNKEIEQ